MASSFAARRTHEARQARVSLARLDLCSSEHYSDAGGVSSLPRGFLLKYQNASITKPMTKAILMTRKMRGRRKAPASFQRRTPTNPTAASCRTGFTITGLGSREWGPYEGRDRKVSTLRKYTSPPPAPPPNRSRTPIPRTSTTAGAEYGGRGTLTPRSPPQPPNTPAAPPPPLPPARAPPPTPRRSTTRGRPGRPPPQPPTG